MSNFHLTICRHLNEGELNSEAIFFVWAFTLHKFARFDRVVRHSDLTRQTQDVE